MKPFKSLMVLTVALLACMSVEDVNAQDRGSSRAMNSSKNHGFSRANHSFHRQPSHTSRQNSHALTRSPYGHNAKGHSATRGYGSSWSSNRNFQPSRTNYKTGTGGYRAHHQTNGGGTGGIYRPPSRPNYPNTHGSTGPRPRPGYGAPRPRPNPSSRPRPRGNGGTTSPRPGGWGSGGTSPNPNAVPGEIITYDRK